MGCDGWRLTSAGQQMLTVAQSRRHRVDTSLGIQPPGPDFKGTRMLGNGIDQDLLRRAGIERADAFVAATQGDNRNIMASQIAQPHLRRQAGSYADLRTRCGPRHGSPRSVCARSARRLSAAKLLLRGVDWRSGAAAAGVGSTEACTRSFAGGGKVGFFLARELIEQGHEVLIIENIADRAEFIANELAM